MPEQADDETTRATLSVSTDGPHVVVRGELDVDSVEVFREALRVATGAGDGGISVDMSGVGFMDSSGLRELLAARQDGREVTINDPSRAVSRLLELSATADLFRIA